MPRNAGARMKLLCVVGALAMLMAGCDDDSPVASEGGVSQPTDASQDGKVDDSGPQDEDGGGGPPWSEVDGSIIDQLEDEYCVVRVTAQCDGAEDCNNAPCCARFEPTEVSFSAMECAEPGESCDFQRTFPACHAGLPCTANNETKCRTSLLIPGDFIGVCAPPTGFFPVEPPTGEPVEGMIDCGSEQCVVGAEQCCMREGFDVRKLRPQKYEPYCAPIGTPCDCTEAGVPPRDDDAGL